MSVSLPLPELDRIKRRLISGDAGLQIAGIWSDRVRIIAVFNRHGGTLRTMDLDAFCAQAETIFVQAWA